VCYTTTKKSIVRAALFFALFSSLFPLSIECLKSRHPTFYVILLARAPHACARVRCAYLVTNGAAPVNASSATPLTHCNLLTARIDPRADAMSGWEQQQQQQQQLRVRSLQRSLLLLLPRLHLPSLTGRKGTSASHVH
jgi:hypothetical protein